MSYKCKECGHIFEAGEQKAWQEKVGEYGSQPCLVENSGCPICLGEYRETTRCKICNSEHLAEDLIEGVCNNCIESYSDDIDVCYKISNREKSSIEINMFLAEMFDEETIEEILLDHLKEMHLYIETHKAKLKKFVNDDKEWFVEKLQEVLKNEK